MANYAAEAAAQTNPGVVTKRTGTASADTVPGGAVVLWRNTGAGSHTVTLTNNALSDGLAVSNRSITLAAGTAKSGRINPAWADADNMVAVAIDGTANEIEFYILGGV